MSSSRALGALLVGAVAAVSLLIPGLPPLPVPALAQTGGMQRQHALSLIGTPKMPADYKNFDWVNPDAPKGGTVRQWAFGTFDSLNPYSVKGSPGGVPTLTSSALFANSPDEPAAEYALIAEWASYPADYSSVTFGLRPQARFSDGSPITPDDVIFSMEALKKAHPRYGYYYKNVVRAEATGAHEVTFTFDEKGNRELPQIVGELPILSKKWWEGKSPNGEQRDLARSTLEVPVGSGPYKIAAVDAGRSITYERIKDWWAKDLPVTKGQWNFDTLRLSYYRDRVAALEDFKAGNIDYWRESVAKSWALDFDFSAVSRGFVKKYEIPTKNVASMQAFVMNLRRPQFQDVRVRRAIGLALDFEAMNKNLFFGFYKRIDSYFGNSELQATGVPEGRELAILEEFRDQLPKELFTTPWQVPVNNTPQDLRAHMLEASKLLAEAGWKIGPDRRLHDAKNQMLAVEILIVQPEFERVVLPFKSNLELLGLQVSVRVVDSAQYERRITGFDYDMIVGGFPQSISPGNEQREFWGSQAADHQGSVNTIGIKNPVIDKLIDRIVFAKDREDLVAATRALDRVLLWNFYVVPQWYLDKEWIAAWDKFARPQTLPSQTSAFLQVWWYDAAADAKLSAARGR